MYGPMLYCVRDVYFMGKTRTDGRKKMGCNGGKATLHSTHRHPKVSTS